MPQRTVPFLPDQYYHFYNRGNNRQGIFFQRDNYLYFPARYEEISVPVCGHPRLHLDAHPLSYFGEDQAATEAAADLRVLHALHPIDKTKKKAPPDQLDRHLVS